MTAFNYARPKATADRLITRFGQTGTLRRPTVSGTAYNPTEGVPVEYACLFVITDFAAHEIDGTRVLATDKKVLLAKGDLAVDPLTSDLLVEADGSVYKIIRVEPLQPGDTVVMHTLQVRR